jgi:phosphatidylserine/phosphatidylglycerophosphate/cardiolipin synthase-like enzyme
MTLEVEMNNTSLFNQDTFYKAFLKDIKKAKTIVLIESPFITEKRLSFFLPIFRTLIKRGVRIVINTKPFEEHNPLLFDQVQGAVASLQAMGVEVYMTIGHHRKLAIIDSEILWEGSLNILSQNDSCEIMRRMVSKNVAFETLRYIDFKKWSK